MSKLKNTLQNAIAAALTDEAIAGAKKKIHDALCELESDFEYHLQSDISWNLASFAQRMANEAILAILMGDEDEMRRHLECRDGQYTGRDGRHSVIHGKLFKIGALAIRKRIVDAHSDLLKNERILDLEDQVASLVRQVNQLQRENDKLLRERIGNL